MAGEWILSIRSALKTPESEEMKNKDLALTTIYAALYAAMVIAFAPLSFAALQFRIAGILRPGIARKRELAIAYGIGTAIANIFSPFAGIYEILFMPVMSIIAGLVGYEIAKRFNGNYFVCGAVIAVIIPISVAWMLSQILELPIILTLPGLFVSEQIVNVMGAVIYQMVDTRLEWWK